MAIDTSRPHIGRIYDFMLGGHHNYEIDRQAAAHILKVAPVYPKWARANRWFLQFVASEWDLAGRKQVLDLATGLPTKGHFNDLMPGARILFTDNDPISVAYGEEILGGNPAMAYRLADLGDPATIVRAADDFFGPDHVVAIACIGIAYLVPDAVLSELMTKLYAWSAPGSVVALTFGHWLDTGDRGHVETALAAFRRFANTEIFMRSAEEIAALASPWRMTEVRTLPDWLGVPDMFTPEELALLPAGMSGAFLER